MALLLDLCFGALNLLVFFYISRTVGRPSDGVLHGAPSYFAFAAVGIIFTLVIQSAAFEQVARARREQLTGVLETLVTQPTSLPELALGLTGAGYLLAALRAAVYLGFAVVALQLSAPRANWLGTAVILLLGTAAMMCIGVMLIALAITVRRGEALVRVILFALAFLSGAYFPARRLPSILQGPSSVIPPRLAIDGLRDAIFLGHPWVANAAWLALTATVLAPVAIWTLHLGLKSLKRRGALTIS